MPPAANLPGLLHFLLADPYVLGTIAWVGLVVTIAGFAVAIQQIRKVNTSAQAAAASVRQLVGVVRSQERSARMNEALMEIRSSQERIKQSSFEAAAAHLYVAWRAAVAARELCDDAEDRERASDYVVSVRLVFEALDNPQSDMPLDAERTQRLYGDLNRIHVGLSEMTIRLSACLSGIGGQ